MEFDDWKVMRAVVSKDSRAFLLHCGRWRAERPDTNPAEGHFFHIDRVSDGMLKHARVTTLN